MKLCLIFIAYILLLSIVKSEIFKEVTLKSCGISKGCIMPAACSDDSCLFVLSWMLVTDSLGEYVEFELKGKVEKITGFIYAGFSKDRKVGEDGIVGCYYNPASSSVQFRAGFLDASGKNAQFYDQSDRNFLITEGENLGGIYNVLDGTLQCRFRRRVKPLNMINQLMDLTTPLRYYIFVLRGSDRRMDGFGRILPGGESISDDSIIISSPVGGSVSRKDGEGLALAKAHGCLMVLAWILCASVGIIMARYYKDMWPNSGLLGGRVWLQSHRILQGTCTGLTCLGVLLAFIYCRGYSKTTAYPFYVHPILGLIVFSLALINPFLTLCRCDPADNNRPWFNWIHFFVGTFAHVLSIPTMMLGLRMPGAGSQLESINYPLWILIYFVIFQFIVEITLELHGCYYYRRNKGKRRMYVVDLEKYQTTKRLGYVRQPRPPEPEPSGRMFKNFVIFLHGTVCAIVTTLLIIIIVVN